MYKGTYRETISHTNMLTDIQMYIQTDVWTYQQMHGCTDKYTDMQKTIHMSAQQGKMHEPMTAPKCK